MIQLSDYIKTYVNKYRNNSFCFCCGKKHSDTDILQFHHISAKNKISDIPAMTRLNDINLVCLEMSKCVLLCSKCHNKIHLLVDTLNLTFKSHPANFRRLERRSTRAKKSYSCKLAKKTFSSLRNRTLSKLDEKIVELELKKFINMLIINGNCSQCNVSGKHKPLHFAQLDKHKNPIKRFSKIKHNKQNFKRIMYKIMTESLICTECKNSFI